MTSVLSGKGSTFLAPSERRTPSLCKGLWQWAAVRARDVQASTRSPGPNSARREDRGNADGQGLRLGSKLHASFTRGAPRYPEAWQGQLCAGRVAVLAGAASAVPMRYNNAAQSDAFRSALNAPPPSAPGRER
jgi:hypothetical protein